MLVFQMTDIQHQNKHETSKAAYNEGLDKTAGVNTEIESGRGKAAARWRSAYSGVAHR